MSDDGAGARGVPIGHAFVGSRKSGALLPIVPQPSHFDPVSIAIDEAFGTPTIAISAAQLIGANGFDDTNRLGSAALAGMPGGAGGYTLAFLCRITAQVNGGFLLDYLDSSPGKGYRLWQDTATSIRFGAANLAGTYVVSPPYYPAADLNKVQLFVMTHSGASGYVDLWASNAKVGGGSATAGFAPATTAGIRNTIGARGNGTASHTGFDWFAAASWDRVLTDAEIHGLYAYVKANGKLPTTGIANVSHVYNVVDNYVGPGFPATITDQVGSSNLTFYAGAASGINPVLASSPVFAWDAPGPQRDVWIAWGDSMCDGRGDAADLATVAPGYEPMNGKLWMLRQPAASTAYAWAELDEPCGTRTPSLQDSCVGPWGLFGWRVSVQTGRETAIINGGVGGSRTDQWVPGQTFYENLRGRAEVALSRENAVFRGFLVYIGPNDAAFSATPPWLANTQATEAGLRTRLGNKPASQAPVIFVQMNAEVPTDVTYAGWAYTRSQQASWQDANHLMLLAPTATKETYHLHHKTVENDVIGQSGAAAAQGHVSWS